MSSDGYFEDGDDDIDPSLLNALDAIEAAHFSPPKAHNQPPPLTRTDSGSSNFFDDVDESELRRLDSFIEDAYQGKVARVTGSSSRHSTKGTLQTTLFGDVLQPEASSSKVKATSSAVRLVAPKRSQFGQQAPKTKVWDRTAFAKSGWRKPALSKGKRKASFGYDEEEEKEFLDEDEEMEFEQFPAPFVSLGPPPAMKLRPDLLEAKHWLYPLNQPKRDYQFNIVKHSLFENTLVALPTGLGKTFVAGVVMLNFYRWFPEGKVIFVAPTKPLVAQQIDACHRTCGIPGDDAAELTGEITKPNRARLWQEKRVFYMTPQTLINDLATGICDPLDIILIVVDEAHKATGSYAYSQVLRFLMAKNPHFRVLALSATPGSDPEKVQSIIDHLHISRIEIRDEASMDLREYMFTKEVKQHIIPMNDDVNKIKDLITKLMEDTLKRLVSVGILEPLNVVKLHPFRVQMKAQELGRRKQFPWAFVPLSKLGFLARAMGYLMEASLKMCYTCLKEVANGGLSEETGKTKSSKTAQGQLRSDQTFQTLMKEIDGLRNHAGGFGAHPKMETLKILLIQHFGGRMGDGVPAVDGGDGGGDGAQETRAMVFVTNRGCVDELVELLNEDSPLLRATKFVGQGTDKQGKKGFAQKEQLDVIGKFKAGHFNVLVSTSIGEEGLDIGEVDLIVCYDAQKAPIRMLQRMGRTGRKRTGYVHVLLSEIREEANWDKAKGTYSEVQKSIVRGDQLELYSDVERLLPDNIKPECLEKKMDIKEYVREEKGKKVVAAGASVGDTVAKKRKRDADDLGRRNIPAGTSAGFVKASELKKRKKTKVTEFDPHAGEDDDTDREIEASLNGPRRTVSTSVAPSGPTKAKKALRKAITMDGSKKTAAQKRTRRKARRVQSTTASQLSHLGVDDSDDLEIERGIDLALCRSNSPDPLIIWSSPRIHPKATERWSSSPDPLTMDNDDEIYVISAHSAATSRSSVHSKSSSSRALPKSPKYWTSSPKVPIADEVINISSSPLPSPPDSPALWSKPSSGIHISDGSSKSPLFMESGGEDKSMAWLLDGDDDPDIEIYDSSPIFNQTLPSTGRPSSNQDISIEILDNSISPSPASRDSRKPQPQPQHDDSVEIVGDDSKEMLPPDTSPLIPLHSNSPSPRGGKSLRNLDMLPPDLPARFAMPFASDPEDPESSFAVRAAGKRPKKRVVIPSEQESPLLEMPPVLQRRFRRKNLESSPAPAPRRKRQEDLHALRKHNPWIDTEAAHSGDEVSEGSSQVDVETEFDRQFLQGHPETQVSPSYDQTLAYRQSLFTQAPARGKAPVFVNRPAARRALFAAGRGGRRVRPLISSSPPINDDEPNEYSMGSFVVDDDAEITYLSSEF